MLIFRYTFRPFGKHLYAIGAKLDWTTASNAFFQVVTFLITYYICQHAGIDDKSSRFASMCMVRGGWILLEGEAAWRAEWDDASMAGLLELGTAFLISYILGGI